MTAVLIKGDNWTQKYTRDNVEMELDIGEVFLQAKEC